MNFKRIASFVVLSALLCTVVPIQTIGKFAPKKVKIRGYITNVVSPTSFEIDDYRVTRDLALILDFENKSPEVQFNPEDIRIGTEIEVQGMFDDDTDELKATKITVDLEQFRKLKNTTVLTRAPENIEKLENGWQGTIWADGRRLRIEPTTQVLFELNKSEKKEAKEQANNKDKQKKEEAKKEDAKKEGAPEEEDDDFADSEPLKAISDVKAGMFVTYEGKEQPDGTILASRIMFMKNEMEKDEAKFWKNFTIKEKPSNFIEGNPGELKVGGEKYKLLPNEAVQKYVSSLGERLIPAHQKRLAADDPQKIPFHFYVVSDKKVNAYAAPNGAVIITSGMITALENEAQLAAVVAHEIAHATQEHSWRQANKDKGKRKAMMIGGIAAAAFGLYGVQNILQLTYAAMVNGYQRNLENQSDRVGLEYMVAAGYDPREAPRVWKIMGTKFGDSPTNFFWSSHDNHATRRSFLMVEIRRNYSQMDMSQTKKGDESEYENIINLTKDAAAKKKKIKVS